MCVPPSKTLISCTATASGRRCRLHQHHQHHHLPRSRLHRPLLIARRRALASLAMRWFPSGFRIVRHCFLRAAVARLPAAHARRLFLLLPPRLPRNPLRAAHRPRCHRLSQLCRRRYHRRQCPRHHYRRACRPHHLTCRFPLPCRRCRHHPRLAFVLHLPRRQAHHQRCRPAPLRRCRCSTRAPTPTR